MLYFIDTNICISCMRGSSKTETLGYKFIIHEHGIRIPSVVVAELMHGAYKSKFGNITMEETEDFLRDLEIVPFDESAARTYGRIKADLERKGLVIGPNDFLIAATALSRNGTLVTNNIREFSRIDGLPLSDWTI